MPAVQLPTLLGGPYKSPRTKLGKTLFDRIRGDVIVSAISQTPIPWPMGRARKMAKLAPILTSELERAVRMESALAIRYWWGVSAWLVWKWRKALGVPWMTKGTAALWRELTPSRLGEHRGPVVGRRTWMKLSPERAQEMKRRALEGENRTALAKEFGVTRQTVSAIVRGVRRV